MLKINRFRFEDNPVIFNPLRFCFLSDVHLNSLRMQCFFEFIPWKKVIVRGCHLLLVFGVIASLVFQPSGSFKFHRFVLLFQLMFIIFSLDLRTALYDEPNYFYCLVYGILVYLSLFFYFMTCYMDPGYVPYRRVRYRFSFNHSDLS